MHFVQRKWILLFSTFPPFPKFLFTLHEWNKFSIFTGFTYFALLFIIYRAIAVFRKILTPYNIMITNCVVKMPFEHVIRITNFWNNSTVWNLRLEDFSDILCFFTIYPLKILMSQIPSLANALNEAFRVRFFTIATVRLRATVFFIMLRCRHFP